MKRIGQSIENEVRMGHRVISDIFDVTISNPACFLSSNYPIMDDNVMFTVFNRGRDLGYTVNGLGYFVNISDYFCLLASYHVSNRSTCMRCY